MPGDLPCGVVPVLLGPEGPPAGGQRVGHLGAQESRGGRVTVGDVDSGDLVVSVVVGRAVHRVEGGRGVAALGQPADWSGCATVAGVAFVVVVIVVVVA